MSDEFELTEEQKYANLLFELYPGLDRAHGRYIITKQGEDGTKTQGRATTELNAYTAELWVAHLLGSRGLGVVPITDNATCSWGAIDIDKYDLDFDELEKKIHSLNLPLLVIRTKSGGAHLTCWFKEPISCKKVRGKLYEFSIALGFGGVEIFPKQSALASKKDVGNWLNMPYFDHLNTQRYAIFKGKKLSVLQFIDLANKIKVDEQTFMNIEASIAGEFDDGPPCLQLITKNGKVPEGTRNSTLFALGVYCRKKWEDDWEIHLEQMNADYVNPPLKSRETQTIIRSLGRKEYFYPCSKTPLQEHCNKDLCKKRPFGIGEQEEDFNLNLGSLVKIASEPPIWILDVEGVRIQLETDELIDQTKFRRACVTAINRLPPLMKRIPWEKMIREKLESVEIMDAPSETKVGTRVNQYVQMFLMNTPQGDTREELLIGRPWYDKERDIIFFRGNDLIRFLENNGLRIEPRKVWNSLRESGTRHKQMSINSTVIQTWFVQASQLAADETPIPEPTFEQDAF